MKKIYLIVVLIVLFSVFSFPIAKYPLVQEFSESNYHQNNMQVFQEYGFELGFNSVGKIVFENPTEAFSMLQEKCFEGIKLIQDEYDLFPLNKFNYKTYGNLGWQVIEGSEKGKEQAAFISRFF